MSPIEPIVLLAIAGGVLLVGLILFLLRQRIWVTPSVRERRRRQRIHMYGRRCDGMLTDASDESLYYVYSVNGVDYNASQDVADLRDHVPTDRSRIIGPVTIKYFVRNPADSLIVCEEWSGLRIRQEKPVEGDS
ncbi:MAG: hypothetical protein U0Q16_26925 [Bryobacteraceae bacterium]